MRAHKNSGRDHTIYDICRTSQKSYKMLNMDKNRAYEGIVTIDIQLPYRAVNVIS